MAAEATADQVESSPAAGPRPLSLRRNFSWTFAGYVIYTGAQWGMLVLLAKLTTPEVVGQFALAQAISAPVMMFASLQLRSIQATDARREFGFGDYLGLRLVAMAAAVAVVTAIACLGGHGRQTASVIVAVALAKAFELTSDAVYGLLQQRELMDRVARLQIFKGVASIAAFGAVLFFTRDVFWASVALAAVLGERLLFQDLPTARRVKAAEGTDPSIAPRFTRSLWRLAWLALPLGVVMTLISLTINIPRYFIDNYLGKAELGVFAALVYLVIAGNTVVGALGQSASPRLSRSYAQGDVHGFVRLLAKLVGVSVVLGLVSVGGALVAGRQILSLIYRPEYAAYTDVFVWLMGAAGVAFVASALNYGMTAARHFRAQPFLFAAVAGVSALGCWRLVPAYGLVGAAWALIAATSLQAVLSAGVVAYAVAHPPD